MSLLDLVILALTRGVAEILPVDPTGHVVLMSKLMGWRPGSITIAIDFAVAMALCCYLWRQIALIGQGLWRLRKGRVEPGTRLLVKALLTAAPWIIVQFAWGDAIAAALPVPLLGVGIVTLASAVIMLVADQLCMTVKRIEHMGWGGALVLGLLQLVAVVPGVGRIAAAVITGRVLGLERPAAYRFLLLASIPALLASAGRELALYTGQGYGPNTADILAAVITFILTLGAVALAMEWLKRSGLTPFVLYRLAVGATMVGIAVL